MPRVRPGAGAGEPGEQRCAVYNDVVYHMDVVAGLAWAFQEAGCGVTCYLRRDRAGMQEVMAEWYKGSFRAASTLPGEAGLYRVIVMATFPEFGVRLERQRGMLEGGASAPGNASDAAGGASAASEQQPGQQQPRFLLVVHNPDQLLGLPWLPPLFPGGGGAPAEGSKAAGGSGVPNAAHAGAAPAVQLAALAPNVAAYTQALLAEWTGRNDAALPWLPPLVPWERDSGAAGRAGEEQYLHLCIQGTISARRRDYAAAFAAAAHPAVLAELRERNESLLLVGGLDPGAVPPPVPKVLQPHVQLAVDLPYQEYYATLARCRAILTAFPRDSDDYLVRKSSSTVAAAIHVGTPLVAEERDLAAYSYLTREATFSYAAPEGAAVADPATAGAAAAAAADASDGAAQQAGTRASARAASLVPAQTARAGSGAGSQPSPQHQQGEAAEQPAPGSYSAALLRAFQPGAAEAAHVAARQLKAELMRRNADVARRAIEGAAAARVT